MGFGTLFPLILLILVPVIILLYMLKQKAQEYEFSSSLLWKEIYQNIEATKPWEKLKNNLLLILQIVAVILFILTLMAPYLKARGVKEEHTILVIDCSASMSTIYDGRNTRLECAQKKACDYIDSLKMGASVTIIASSDIGNLIVTNATDKTELKKSVQNIGQTIVPGTVTNSMSLIQSVASQWEDSEILVFTDTSFDFGNLDVGIVALYNDAINVSMDYMSYSETKDGNTVLVRVTNHTDQPLQREINLYSGEDLLDISQVTLAAYEIKVVYFTNVQPTDPILCGELQETDDLLQDNEVYCVMDESVTNRILLVTKSNLFLEKALLNLAGIEVYRTNDVSQIQANNQSGEIQFDLYILDGVSCNVQDLPNEGNLFLINSTVEGLVTTKEVLKNKMLTFVEGDVTAYIANELFGVNEASIYELPKWGTSFIQVAEAKNVLESTVGFLGECDGRKVITMGFDLHQTDLGLCAPFPILISNVMEYLLNNGLVSQPTFVAGDTILLNGSTKGSVLQIQRPDGTIHEMAPSFIASSYPNADLLGVYEVSQELDGERKAQSFSVNFPSNTESCVQSIRSILDHDDSTQEEILIEGAIDLKQYVLVLLIALLLLEWYIYSKRT